jgi:hypothetical protein
MKKYEILFEIKLAANARGSLTQTFVESDDVKLSTDWVEFTTGPGAALVTIAGFPREKIFGFRKVEPTA